MQHQICFTALQKKRNEEGQKSPVDIISSGKKNLAHTNRKLQCKQRQQHRAVMLRKRFVTCGENEQNKRKKLPMLEPYIVHYFRMHSSERSGVKVKSTDSQAGRHT